MLEDIQFIHELSRVRTNDLSEPINLYLKVAEQLENTYRHNYITRPKLIREQCNDLDGRETFDKFREDWGIWNFKEI